ncbi:efflux transporter outer membrane subunit [Fulvivirga sp.]|uniref:efflux transporter outer membrane subunit n=1 Tax=Fulvivirga sp. TaxID=1931237 RepID=UPI0032EC5153
MRYLLLGAIHFVALYWLAACTPQITSVSPPIEEPEVFSKIEGDTLINKWWRSFENEQLNGLMDSAFTNNMNLNNLYQQIVAAQAVRKSQSTFLLPDIDAQAQTAVRRPEPDFAGGENTQIGVSASYEIDLWGRIRAGVQAADFRIQGSYYDYQAAAMTLSANVATLWFQLLINQEQLELINNQVATNKEVIKLIKARFGAGQVKGVDVLRQEQLLEQSKSLKIQFEANYQQTLNQLAALLGKPPQNFKLQVIDSLPIIPPAPSAGMPLELIRRRPDIQRDYSFLMAADREMAQAVRNRFPRLSLDLSAQARSNNYSQLFSSWAYTLGANLAAPLLYWGRLKAEVDRTEAVKNQQLYQYGETVLNAFLEVENGLINEERQRKQVKILRKRLEMAQQTNKQLRTEFIYGFSPYLDVLLSQDQEQQLQRNLLEAIQDQYEIRISLYRALAGDFQYLPADEENIKLNP